ncbi:MAG: hypothetical protein JNK98_10605, partial [Chitinophagaceae bacterium]|nr:hypothetical protein [Chitinophagaceae bacterium]
MNYSIEQFYRLFQGALVFQGIFFGGIYFMTHRKDVLFYSLYLLSAAAYFFINATGTFFNIDENHFFESRLYYWLNIPLIIAQNFFYLLFIHYFFKDIITSVQVKKILKLTLLFAPLLIVVFLLLRIMNADTQLIFYTVNLLSIPPAAIIIFHVLKNKLPYALLVTNGLICTVAGTLLTVCMIYMGNNGATFLLAASYPLFFMRLGLLGDMFFYQLALLKKWREQEKELATAELKTRLVVEEVKGRISKELHDDVGSTLSGISMYSYMAMQQAENEDNKAVSESIKIIQHSSDEMVNRLKDIVWFNKQGAGSMAATFERLKEYTAIMSRAKGIELITETDVGLTGLVLADEMTYNISLIGKEAVNNAVKYSEATVVTVKA